MTDDDFKKFERLYAAVYKKGPLITNRDMRIAWSYALVPYPYDAVKAAFLRYVTTHKAPPDIYDITGGIPTPPPETDTARQTPTAEGVIGNVRAWAIVTGRTMPEGMTATEAFRWYERQQRVAG